MSKLVSDIVVEVPDIASAYRNRMKVADISSEKELVIFNQIKVDIEGAGILPGTNLPSITVQLDEPSLDDTMPDNERLIWKIQEMTGAEKVVICYTALRKLIQQMCAAAKLNSKQVYRMCLAGNTTMNHLLLGLYTDPVRMEPYMHGLCKLTNGITTRCCGSARFPSLTSTYCFVRWDKRKVIALKKGKEEAHR